MSEHGTRSRYNAGCRCPECRAANSAYERARVRRRAHEAQGRPSKWVDAAPVRRMLERLYAQGVSGREIERMGVSRSVQRQICTAHWRTGRPVARCLRSTKDKIAAMRASRRPAPRQLVDASWASEWVREYRRRGLPAAEIAEAVGCSRATVDAMAAGRRESIEAATLYGLVKAKPHLDRISEVDHD